MKNKRLKFNRGELVYHKDFSSLENKNKNNIETSIGLKKQVVPKLNKDIHELTFTIKKKF
jgi:hypothetical protein